MSPRDKQQHKKIADYLREQISSGVLQPGDFLPSEADLCEKFSSSRGPVRQAVAALRAEGLVSSGRGRRSTVLASTQAELFESIYSISSWLSEYDADPQQHTLWLARRRAPRRAHPRHRAGRTHRRRHGALGVARRMGPPGRHHRRPPQRGPRARRPRDRGGPALLVVVPELGVPRDREARHGDEFRPRLLQGV